MLRISVTADEQLNIDHNVIHKGLKKQASAAESTNSLGAQLEIPFLCLIVSLHNCMSFSFDLKIFLEFFTTMVSVFRCDLDFTSHHSI